MHESIEVYYKNIQVTNNLFYHKHIIYTDKDGIRFFARGGVEGQSLIPTPFLATAPIYKFIHTFFAIASPFLNQKMNPTHISLVVLPKTERYKTLCQ